MLGIHELWLFVISGLLLNITPGPDTAYIVGRSIQLGWRGGAVAVLGIEAGCLLHVFAVAVGLSALLAASSVAFTLVKWAPARPIFASWVRECCWHGLRRLWLLQTEAARFRYARCSCRAR